MARNQQQGWRNNNDNGQRGRGRAGDQRYCRCMAIPRWPPEYHVRESRDSVPCTHCLSGDGHACVTFTPHVRCIWEFPNTVCESHMCTAIPRQTTCARGQSHVTFTPCVQCIWEFLNTVCESHMTPSPHAHCPSGDGHACVTFTHCVREFPDAPYTRCESHMTLSPCTRCPSGDGCAHVTFTHRVQEFPDAPYTRCESHTCMAVPRRTTCARDGVT